MINGVISDFDVGVHANYDADRNELVGLTIRSNLLYGILLKQDRTPP